MVTRVTSRLLLLRGMNIQIWHRCLLPISKHPKLISRLDEESDNYNENAQNHRIDSHEL